MIIGTYATAVSFAGNWATVELLRCGLVLTLDRERDRSGWTTFVVLGTRLTCLTASSQAGGLITVHIMKMLESLVLLVINCKINMIFWSILMDNTFILCHC